MNRIIVTKTKTFNRWLRLSTSALGVAVLLSNSVVHALPTADRIVPNDIVIPKLANGRLLPVTLFSSRRDSKEIYVLPNEGIFKGKKQAMVPPTTDCSRVESAIGQLKHFDKDREMRLKLLERDRDRLVAAEENLYQLSLDLGRKQKEKAAVDEELKQAKAVLDAKTQDLATALADLRSAQSELSAAQLVGDSAAIKAAEEKVADAKRNYAMAQIQKNKAETEANQKQSSRNMVARQIADLQGEIDGSDEAAQEIRRRYDDSEARFNAFEAKILANIQTFFSDQGAIVRMNLEYAPSVYLEALSRANRDYTFTYVPTAGAAVKLTFPEFKPDSLLNKMRGNMVITQEWDSAERAYSQNAFFRALSGRDDPEKGKEDETETPLEDLQALAMAYSDSLSGARSLTLVLSSLGYCALQKPSIIANEIQTGSAETFSMSLFMAYPMQYHVTVKGEYNRTKILHEVFKKSKSSSWFGLRKSEKQEFIRRVSDREHVDISVDGNSPLMGQAETTKLREAMATQIAFMVAKEHLQFEKAPAPQFENMQSPSGASQVGKMLMTVSNPWAFWGGVALTSLDSMFGGRSQTAVNDQISHDWKQLSWNERFSLLHSHVVSIGDLREAEIINSR